MGGCEMENDLLKIEQLTVEILFLKQQTAQNIIEIGKRLSMVKESLPHGEWRTWLNERVSFKERTSQRFMQVAREIPNPSMLTNLSQSKIFAILDLPEEYRKEFINQQHQINGEEKTINEMTTREIQQVIKEKKEIENQLKEIQLNNKTLIEENKQLKIISYHEPIIIEKEVIKEIEKPVVPKDYVDIKTEKQKLEQKVKNLAQINGKLQGQLSKAADVKLEAINTVKFRNVLFDMTTMIAKSLKEAELSKDLTAVEEVKSQSIRTITELKKVIEIIETWICEKEGGYIDAEYTII